MLTVNRAVTCFGRNPIGLNGSARQSRQHTVDIAYRIRSVLHSVLYSSYLASLFLAERRLLYQAQTLLAKPCLVL